MSSRRIDGEVALWHAGGLAFVWPGGRSSRRQRQSNIQKSMARFSMASYSLRRDDLQPFAIKRRSRRSYFNASTLASLLCSASLLISSPNIDGIACPGAATVLFDSTALALEDNVKDESSSWSSSSSELSDQLLKSLAGRESTRDPNKQRYWDSMKGTSDDIKVANEKLIDHAVATVSTMYYDSSGGFNFDAQEFYAKWKSFRYSALHPSSGEKKIASDFYSTAADGFATRDNAVQTLKSIVASLNDPYSKYLTREELRTELESGSDGFLGLGAFVDVSDSSHPSPLALDLNNYKPISQVSSETLHTTSSRSIRGASGNHGKRSSIISVAQAANFPVITAIVPDSPAERAGLAVGDRIVSVGDYKFTGMSQSQVQRALEQKFHAQNYFGRVDLKIAKQVRSPLGIDSANLLFDAEGNIVEEKYVFENGWYQPTNVRHSVFDYMPSEQIIGYKLSHVKSLPTTQTAKSDNTIYSSNADHSFPSIVGGDSIVHYELLTPEDSIFQHMANADGSRPVGYIRLTRFSKASTAGYINAINSLEDAGAQSYIIDLRNNYGGVIQEAMVTASSLLRDPHYVLCYTLNSKGGFKPQENMEYIVDAKYPGYLLSSESRTVSRDQVRREHPEYLEDGGWSSPTSYASLNELRMTRGIKPAHVASSGGASDRMDEKNHLERPTAILDRNEIDVEKLMGTVTKNSQKKLVILVNEGTGKTGTVCSLLNELFTIVICLTFTIDPLLKHQPRKSSPARFMTMVEPP
jgi:C-terminal processing protease CtpA/Prc